MEEGSIDRKPSRPQARHLPSPRPLGPEHRRRETPSPGAVAPFARLPNGLQCSAAAPIRSGGRADASPEHPPCGPGRSAGEPALAARRGRRWVHPGSHRLRAGRGDRAGGPLRLGGRRRPGRGERGGLGSRHARSPPGRFESPAIDDAGSLLFQGELSTASGVVGGLFLDDGATTVPVVLEGDPLPGPTGAAIAAALALVAVRTLARTREPAVGG